MTTIKLIGAPQSPYSRKMRSALRYKRIPFQWIRTGTPEAQGHPKTKIPGMIPILWFSEQDPSQDIAMLDSTFQLKHLQRLFPERSLYPDDSVINFFATLLEDFADEWMTKCMFHFRWSREADIKKAGTLLPMEIKWNQTDDSLDSLKKDFSEHQIGRLGVVGSNPLTQPIIEQSFIEVLGAMNTILTQQAYLLGDKPSVADFAFFGQLACLTQFDPTPSRLTMEHAPRVYAWVEALEDCSGESANGKAWIARDYIQESLSPLLNIISKYYIPVLIANAQALSTGAEKVTGQIDGAAWEQKPFPYQGKCLVWLKEAFMQLDDKDQDFVRKILETNNCDRLIKES